MMTMMILMLSMTMMMVMSSTPTAIVKIPFTVSSNRIGIMSLVRKKVQEFEAINGTHSMPNAVIEESGEKVCNDVC